MADPIWEDDPITKYVFAGLFISILLVHISRFWNVSAFKIKWWLQGAGSLIYAFAPLIASGIATTKNKPILAFYLLLEGYFLLGLTLQYFIFWTVFRNESRFFLKGFPIYLGLFTLPCSIAGVVLQHLVGEKIHHIRVSYIGGILLNLGSGAIFVWIVIRKINGIKKTKMVIFITIYFVVGILNFGLMWIENKFWFTIGNCILQYWELLALLIVKLWDARTEGSWLERRGGSPQNALVRQKSDYFEMENKTQDENHPQRTPTGDSVPQTSSSNALYNGEDPEKLEEVCDLV